MQNSFFSPKIVQLLSKLVQLFAFSLSFSLSVHPFIYKFLTKSVFSYRKYVNALIIFLELYTIKGIQQTS